MTPKSKNKVRLATAWLGGCSGCHMSFLDLGEALIDLAAVVDLVYSPVADIKKFPENVDVALVEGSIANMENLHLAKQIRQNSKVVISFGDCAVTGNVPAMRNRLQIDDILSQVYVGGPGEIPHNGGAGGVLPKLMSKVLPLHQVIAVDLFIPGCPPDTARISEALNALLEGRQVQLDKDMRTFG